MGKTSDFRESFESVLNHQRRLKPNVTATVESHNLIRADAKDAALSKSSTLATQGNEHDVQRPIRSWLGKSTAFNDGKIGAHPDFLHLAGTEEYQYHYVTTMFVDIKNSTRLALKYDLETVQWIKNSILRAASEVVRALDGHVHRFMGDALMAFFGGSSVHKESSALAAINCSAFLRLLMELSVIPSLKSRNIDVRDLGFRVGVDFGDDEKVLWSSYGYSNVHEVTATSFHVDVSAKLQSMASKDATMLGHCLIEFLDLPEPLYKIKNEIRDGVNEQVPYLRPNFIGENGEKINYLVRELDFKKFIRLLPIPTDLKSTLAKDIIDLQGVTFESYIEKAPGIWVNYRSLSRCLEKGQSIKFQITASRSLMASFRSLDVVFTKTNYGKEAEANTSTAPETITKTLLECRNSAGQYQLSSAEFIRDTAYRGIHTVDVVIKTKEGKEIFKDAIAVHIE